MAAFLRQPLLHSSLSRGESFWPRVHAARHHSASGLLTIPGRLADAKQPEDWDEEEDGEWEPPRIPNPKCEDAPGCGEWVRPTKSNPDYKGKWSAPMIDNPAYKVRRPAWLLCVLLFPHCGSCQSSIASAPHLLSPQLAPVHYVISNGTRRRRCL